MAPSIRVGQGFDVHRFEPAAGGRALVVGGVTFPGERGVVSHSDEIGRAHV